METHTISPTLYNYPNHPHKFFFNVDRIQCPSTHSSSIWYRICDCCQRDYLLIRSINRTEKIYGMFSCVECDFDLCPECFIREPNNRELSLTNFSLELKIDQKTFNQARQYGLEHKDDDFCHDDEDPRNDYDQDPDYRDSDSSVEDVTRQNELPEEERDASPEKLLDEERRN